MSQTGYGAPPGGGRLVTEAVARMRRMRRASRRACLERMLADPADPRHGTAAGYAYGCRCDRCRAARAEESRRYAERKRNPPPPPLSRREEASAWWLVRHGIAPARVAEAYGVGERAIQRAVDRLAWRKDGKR